MVSPMVFKKDAQGRRYSDSDPVQLALTGVERIYHDTIADPNRADVARLMNGQCHVPLDGLRRPGLAYITRQSLEAALWKYRSEPTRLQSERAILLRKLIFDSKVPYEVLLDPDRSLYVFATVGASDRMR